MFKLAFKALLIMAAAGLLAAAILILAKWIAVALMAVLFIGAFWLWLQFIFRPKGINSKD